MSINVEEDKVRVHQTHCCVLHGCKYGHDDDGCPVVACQIDQEYVCEDCDSDGIDTIDQAKAAEKEMSYCSDKYQNYFGFGSDLLDDLILGRMIRAKPEFTDLNPDPGFEIVKYKFYQNRLLVCGEHTNWFGEHEVEVVEDI